MNRLPQNTVNRIESSPVSWLNFSDLVEPIIEQTLTWFEVLGYTVLLQSDIVSGRHQSILQHYHNGILVDRLYPALRRINPTASQPQLDDILCQLVAPRTQPIVLQNRQWHGQLLRGLPVSSRIDSQSQPLIQLVDFDHLLNNDWLVIRSFPVVEADHQRCLDLVVFINGLPLAVFHGWQGGGESWSLRAAYLQLQTYQVQLPQFFALNELLILSNGIQARIGTLTNSWRQFAPIRSANGEEIPLAGETEMEAFVQGIFDKRRFLEIIRHQIGFQQRRTNLTKKLQPYPFCTISLPKNLSRDWHRSIDRSYSMEVSDYGSSS